MALKGEVRNTVQRRNIINDYVVQEYDNFMIYYKGVFNEEQRFNIFTN